MRSTLVIRLGMSLVIFGLALAAVLPIAVGIGSDKLFLVIFWWANNYGIISLYGGLLLSIAGVLVFLAGMEMDKPTVIPPPWMSH